MLNPGVGTGAPGAGDAGTDGSELVEDAVSNVVMLAAELPSRVDICIEGGLEES